MSASLMSDRTRLRRRPELVPAQSAGTDAVVPVQLHGLLSGLSTVTTYI